MSWVIENAKTKRCAERCPVKHGESITPSWSNLGANHCIWGWCHRSGGVCGDLKGCHEYAEEVSDYYKCCNIHDRECTYDSSTAARRAADTPKLCREADNGIWHNYVATGKPQRECGDGTYRFTSQGPYGTTHYCYLSAYAKNGAKENDVFIWLHKYEQYFCMEKNSRYFPGCKGGKNIATYI